MTQATPTTARRHRVRVVGLLTAALVATGGLAVAAAAPASAYTNVYKTQKACLTAQRSLGHSSSIVITVPCHEVLTGCVTGSNGQRLCNSQYDFSWRYR